LSVEKDIRKHKKLQTYKKIKFIILIYVFSEKFGKKDELAQHIANLKAARHPDPTHNHKET
jgi:hypothetical protein